jgi:hypothetical protein
MKRTAGFICLILAFIMACPGLFAVESMGLYQANNYKNSAKESVTYFDTVAWTYTRPNYFNIQITFADRDISKRDKKSSGDHQFFFELTRDQYAKIFESNFELNNFPINDNMWSRNISTKVTPQKRIVKIAFVNAIDDEITEVFKRGTLELVITRDEIQSMKMTKERKRFLNIGGYKTIFVGEARRMKRVKKGLGLIDSGEMGRITSKDTIDQALASKDTKGFAAAIKAEKR